MAQGMAQPAALSQPGAFRAVLVLFVLCLVIPANFDIAGLNLSATRFFVLIALFPLFIQWMSARAGGIQAVDLLVLLHGVWIVLALVVNHGLPRFAYGGMLLVETMGGFLIGRMLIRGAADYVALFKLLLGVMAVLLPFALIELVTDRPIMQDLSRMLLGSGHGNVNHPPRMGFYRVQSVMQHPILFGVFCSTTVANAYFIWSYSKPAAFLRTGFAMAVTFTSLSSGALLASVLQILMIGWGRVTGNAWKLLAMGAVSMYVFLSFASNRGPIVLLIETLTFNSGTGWTRIHIWNHGIDDVMRNKVFGIGLGDWTRPGWLAESVDNFWLLTSMRYGIVGVALLAAAFAFQTYKVTTARNLTNYEKQLRIGYMIGLISLSLSLATVHIWGPPYVLIMAYLGAGTWFYARPASKTGAPDAETVSETGAGASERPRPRAVIGAPQYSRMRVGPVSRTAPRTAMSQDVSKDASKTPSKTGADRTAIPTRAPGARKPAVKASPYSRTVLSGPKKRR